MVGNPPPLAWNGGARCGGRTRVQKIHDHSHLRIIASSNNTCTSGPLAQRGGLRTLGHRRSMQTQRLRWFEGTDVGEEIGWMSVTSGAKLSARCKFGLACLLMGKKSSRNISVAGIFEGADPVVGHTKWMSKTFLFANKERDIPSLCGYRRAASASTRPALPSDAPNLFSRLLLHFAGTEGYPLYPLLYPLWDDPLQHKFMWKTRFACTQLGCSAALPGTYPQAADRASSAHIPSLVLDDGPSSL